jgi:hypothetical protein
MEPKPDAQAKYSSPLPGTFRRPKGKKPVPPAPSRRIVFRRFWYSRYMIPVRLALALPLFIFRGLWQELRGSRLPALQTELERLRLEIASLRADQAKARAEDRQAVSQLAQQISHEVQGRLDSMHREIRAQLERDWQTQIHTEVARQLHQLAAEAKASSRSQDEAKEIKHVGDDLVNHLLRRR